jgi:ABC-type nickel/cobalt efflux system permease component RcnA
VQTCYCCWRNIYLYIHTHTHTHTHTNTHTNTHTHTHTRMHTHTHTQIREQSPVQNLLLVLAVFFACALGNTLLEDQHVSVVVRGGKACAADHDLLDQVSFASM